MKKLKGLPFYFPALFILLVLVLAAFALSQATQHASGNQSNSDMAVAQGELNSQVTIAVTVARCQQKAEDTFVSEFERECLKEGNPSGTCAGTTLTSDISYSLLSPGSAYEASYKKYESALSKC